MKRTHWKKCVNMNSPKMVFQTFVSTRLWLYLKNCSNLKDLICIFASSPTQRLFSSLLLKRYELHPLAAPLSSSAQMLTFRHPNTGWCWQTGLGRWWLIPCLLTLNVVSIQFAWGHARTPRSVECSMIIHIPPSPPTPPDHLTAAFHWSSEYYRNELLSVSMTYDS